MGRVCCLASGTLARFQLHHLLCLVPLCREQPAQLYAVAQRLCNKASVTIIGGKGECVRRWPEVSCPPPPTSEVHRPHVENWGVGGGQESLAEGREASTALGEKEE